MCLAVPGKILDTQNLGESRIGRVEFGGVTRQTCLDFVPEANVGDYVLVHVGFALNVLDEEEANRTYQLLERIGMLETDVEIEAEDEARIASVAGTLHAIH